jgi:hypothetical protein
MVCHVTVCLERVKKTWQIRQGAHLYNAVIGGGADFPFSLLPVDQLMTLLASTQPIRMEDAFTPKMMELAS